MEMTNRFAVLDTDNDSEIFDKRVDAFNILSNRDRMKKNLCKTKLCKFVSYNKECIYGTSCQFAHTLDELKVNNCFFGNDCNRITFKDNKIFNTNDRNKCMHFHPGETKSEFLARTQPQIHEESVTDKNIVFTIPKNSSSITVKILFEFN